jgi:hypothetical protein
MTTDRNHQMSSDEVRRTLRDIRAEHDDALPTWRRTLDRILDPATGATADEKATLLGVPNRRTFLMGGMVLAGGAVLAACGQEDAQVPRTGTLPAVPSTTTTTAPGSAETDRVLLQTAQSIEILAVETYQTALDSDLLTEQAAKDIAELFQAQHQDHADALAAAIRTAGGSPVTEANGYLLTNVVEPAVAELTDQTSVLVLAREVENVAAQTYTEAGGVFSTSALRRTGMSIGEIEARHVTVLNIALGYSPVPLPLLPTAVAIDPKGYVA